jgi:hypothetical protein
MASLEKIVEGTFRALLLCSAVYFGAKYASSVLAVADKVKEKIVPQQYLQKNQTLQNSSNEVPLSLINSDPRLYNAIMINRYMSNGISNTIIPQEETRN